MAGKSIGISGPAGAQARVLVIIVGKTAAQRARLSRVLAESRHFRIMGSFPLAGAVKTLQQQPADLILGSTNNPAEYGQFVALSQAFPNVLSLLVVSDRNQLGFVDDLVPVVCFPASTVASRQDLVLDRVRAYVNATRIHGTAVESANRLDQEKLAFLSDREREVLILTAEGLSLRDIAARLHRGYSTITTHRNAIMRKLHLHDKVALARFAIRVGLIQA